ncbi:hypothetical protein [Saccharomonospora iraqiensis]|uniref:hypothetical protein n=1 Tax=Saccharomonospora iraqiensis TaxID=52698 RepID=UPI0018DB6987|nr:hypothetical protein [Saccharomonospora iraqiensis]
MTDRQVVYTLDLCRAPCRYNFLGVDPAVLVFAPEGVFGGGGEGGGVNERFPLGVVEPQRWWGWVWTEEKLLVDE